MESGKQLEKGTLGNTSTKVPSLRGHNWGFTLNNYHLLESGKLEEFKQWIVSNCEKANVGKEVGEKCGTPHLQGFIKCKENIRFNKLKDVCRACHWFQCKGSEISNYDYTSKEGDIWLTFGCEVLDEKKPSKTKGPKKHGGHVINTATKIMKLEDIPEPFLRYIDLYNSEPDGRSVHWFCNYKGNLGKSQFTKYMSCTYEKEVRFLKGGKYSDICSFIFHTDMSEVKMVIFDLPRTTRKISYNGMEAILDGMISNTKYETGISLFDPPHVVVFANWYPDVTQLSEDRWKIIEYDPENRDMVPKCIDHGLDDD